MVFDRDVLTFDISCGSQPVTECGKTTGESTGGSAVYEGNHRYCRLLGAHRHRPSCHRPAEQRDELAAFHSMTSSARASRVGGTSRPRALAVLRLITSSYLVGCCTGRSAGFSPFRIRST